MSDVERAAARLRRHKELGCTSVEPHPRCPYRGGADMMDDRETVSDAYLAELNPTPVTEEWARLASTSVDGCEYAMSKGLVLLCWKGGGISFAINNQIICEGPTIGQGRTACRLFGVTLKEESSDER